MMVQLKLVDKFLENNGSPTMNATWLFETFFIEGGDGHETHTVGASTMNPTDHLSVLPLLEALPWHPETWKTRQIMESHGIPAFCCLNDPTQQAWQRC